MNIMRNIYFLYFLIRFKSFLDFLSFFKKYFIIYGMINRDIPSRLALFYEENYKNELS